MRILKVGALAAAAVYVAAPSFALAAAAAAADTAVAESFFARDRNTSVKQRPRPDYEAIGIPMGGFTAFPRISADVEYNDNIYASAVEESDTIFRVKPQLGIRSNWSRNLLSAYARGNIIRYADRTTENEEEYAFGAATRIDFLRASNFYAGVDQQWLIEPRTSAVAPTAASSPVNYELLAANAGFVHELSRTRLSARVDYADFNYKNTTTRAGAFLLQDDRDREMITVTGRAEYGLSPATAFFVSAKANWREYRLERPAAAIDRDSNGYSITGGVNFDITNLLRGEVEVGYVEQDYDAFAENLTGLAYGGQIEWFPTQLTTVTLRGGRTVEEATVAGTPGFFANTVGLDIDHELMRNLLIGATGTYTVDNYKSIDRKDDRYGLGLSATYLINHAAAFSLNYSLLNQDSNGARATNNYNVNRIFGSLTLQF